MILRVSFARKQMFPSSQEEVEGLISEALRFISPKEGDGSDGVTEDEAWFSYLEPQADFPSACLRVAANELTGFGALVWFVFGRKGGIYDDAWISDNPTPPEIDSRLVCDPYYPRFHDPASAVPLPQVREAIREFCRSATGERPESIAWVTGEINGPRNDRPSYED
ncbi:Imm1 family immunity protein [Kitasatospora sp. NPDC056181]|uniref:Imm1 family immunity protein n=1 Tax=Kitasatospora sp. NPDC056181 TaxID=3345737 RepID=UPI0035D5BC44